MTRHSPSEAALGEVPVSGLHANFTLLSAFNDAVGKEVLLELVDGSVFAGIFGGASSEMEVGLYCAYEKTPENEKNLLPLKKDLVNKRQFNFADIVCVTVPTNDEKLIRGFATDRDYHNKRRNNYDEDDELEAWEGDGEDVDLESAEAVKAAATRNAAAARNGWGVNEMFAANQSLGVKTTFEDNLSQYTTAEVEGTEEDRRRADEIARAIEKSGSSRMYSALENDDEERDLDKITDETELLGYESKNKNWSNGISTTDNFDAPASLNLYPKSVPNGTYENESKMRRPRGPLYVDITSMDSHSSSPPRPPSLMTAPPGFPNTPPGGFTSMTSEGFTPVISGRGRKGITGTGGGGTTNDHSHNTYLPLVNRGVNNNGRGGSQKTPSNDRAALLKGPDPRRSTNNGGMGPVRGGGAPLPSPKGGQTNNYVKRDSYDGSTGGGQQQHYNNDNWSKGGMKTYENTKMRDQKMMLENRNSASNSPRNASGPPTGPPTTNKGGTSGRVEGLKAWQQDINISYSRENKPSQKGPGEKADSPPQSAALVESTPPTKNAWQSGPPSGLTSSSRSDESKSTTTIPSPSIVAPTPAESTKMNEEREVKEDVGASTSHEEERKEETSEEKKEDADISRDSAGKKFSFNPDAPAFTPKFNVGSTGGGGGMVPPSLPQTPMMVQPMPPTMMGGQMTMQAPMGGMGAMGGMQQPAMIYSYPTQPHYPNMQQYSAVVNGGAIMAGAANGQGQTLGGPPSTPRGTNGGQGGTGGGGGMGGGPRGGPRGAPNQGTNVQGGAVPVTMPGGAMYMPQTAYQQVQMQQQTYMQQPNPYYQYAGGQPTMIQGAYPIPMTMQQQGMMGQPQRYVPQATHPGMMMQYNVQQQYGGGPPGVNPQQGGGLPMGSGGGQQGGGGGNGATSSSSTTNGGPASNVGVGQGGPPNAHPPSQPPTPGAVPPSSQTGGGGPPQSGMMTSQGGPPGMAPPPVPSPSMYGIPYPQGVMYYNQAGGGMEMHGGGGGEGAEGMHPMQHPYQYNPGQYFQSAPPHLRATYPNMSHGMQQQQQQHAPAQPSQSQN